MPLRKALLLLATLLACAVATARAQTPYALVNPPQPTESDGKIEVIEFFWYGCPHCYRLEPEVSRWLKTKPDDVVFKRVPAYPSESWGEMARVFYTMEAMGLLDQFHAKIFDAIHKDGLNLNNKKIRDEWLRKNGIDPAKYENISKSFTVVSKMARARQLTQAYRVDSVPRVFVDGKYYTEAELAGGPDKIFAVVDQLIAMERKSRGMGGGAKAKK